jgi:hypothetical protein
MKDMQAYELKENKLGNLSISIYWEEKIMIIIKFCQIYSFLLVATYELWPFSLQTTSEGGLAIIGFNFIYLKGFYTLVVDFAPIELNFIVWASLTVVLVIVFPILNLKCKR